MKILTLKTLVALASLNVLFALPAAAQSIFPDKNLEDVVRKYVFAKRNNNEPIKEEDVKNISTIEGVGNKITDLRGLEKCRSLALLNLRDNAISDLAPIKDLKNLQSLDLSDNKITDVKALEGLTGLQYLELSKNRIANVASLAKLSNLRSLYLSENEIADLKPVAGLTKLWSLYLAKNKVKDVKQLEKLTKLSNLDLIGNEIADLAPLAKMTELRHLMLERNKVSDLSTLLAMAKKDNAGDKRFAPFWNIYLYGNPLSDDAKSKQVEELKKIGSRVHLTRGGQGS